MAIVISNASPLIGLSQIQRLHVMQALWKEILIPEAVYREVVLDGSAKAGAQLVKEACQQWIKIVSIQNTTEVQALHAVLDDGEAEVIVSGQELSADLLVLDNREPRLFAKKLGLKVIGTVGILQLAWQKALIKEPVNDLLQLQRRGFWIENALIERVRHETQK